MSFAVLGAERLLAFRENASVSAGIGATLALALAVLSRVHVALLLACLVPFVLNELPTSIARWRSLLVAHPFWQRIAPQDRYATTGVPSLNIAGWYDIFADGTYWQSW